MTWKVVPALTGIMLALGSHAPATPQQAKPSPVPGWLADVPSGLTAAQKTGKPLMIVFR